MKALEREVHELRQTTEILRKASAYLPRWSLTSYPDLLLFLAINVRASRHFQLATQLHDQACLPGRFVDSGSTGR